MKQGKARFLYFLSKVEVLFENAKSEKNIANYLFLNDLRTPMFMLEGLSKLYTKINDEHIFDSLKEQFKLIEDALGGIGFYAAYKNEFKENVKVPNEIIAYFEENQIKKLNEFHQILEGTGWLNGQKIEEIKGILNQIDWDKEEKEIEKIKKYYQKQVLKINEFIEEVGFPFTNVEEHIHELRRRVRWLSIYPHALQGVIQLVDSKPIANHLIKYQLPEVVNSKYNILPLPGEHTSFLILNKQKFLALSWFILELGNLKDFGLKIHALNDAFSSKFGLNAATAEAKTYSILGSGQQNQSEILTRATEIAKIFFKENNLDFIEN